MPYIPPNIVSQAREMDLLTYLQNYEPQELVHFGGNTYCTREHDSLKISDGKWCWFSRGIGGRSALDFFLLHIITYPTTAAYPTLKHPPALCNTPVRFSEAHQSPSLFTIDSEGLLLFNIYVYHVSPSRR